MLDITIPTDHRCISKECSCHRIYPKDGSCCPTCKYRLPRPDFNSPEYKREDGSIDWNKLHVDERELGFVCKDCGGYIFSEAKGYPQKCTSCENLKTRTKEEVYHDNFVRCPNCGETFCATDDDGRCYGDGEHDTYCPECEHEFTFVTHVSFSFQSPEMLPNFKTPQECISAGYHGKIKEREEPEYCRRCGCRNDWKPEDEEE